MIRIFRTLKGWNWKNGAIKLVEIQDGGPHARRVWNRTGILYQMLIFVNIVLFEFYNSYFVIGLMPIITPVYPSMNSSFNVTESTRKILFKEIQVLLSLLLSVPIQILIIFALIFDIFSLKLTLI